MKVFSVVVRSAAGQESASKRISKVAQYIPANRVARAKLISRDTSCQGILDSYRKAKAASKGPPGQDVQAEPPTLAAYNPLIFESADEDTCPAECVEEVSTPADFKAKCQDAGDAVVVLDLYKTSCGACKYLMPGFLNLCKDAYSEEQSSVVFLKHNVFDDEEDEKTELARRLRVRGVPKFMIFKNMELLEEFSTRDKKQLIEAVRKHSASKVDLGAAP